MKSKLNESIENGIVINSIYESNIVGCIINNSDLVKYSVENIDLRNKKLNKPVLQSYNIDDINLNDIDSIRSIYK